LEKLNNRKIKQKLKESFPEKENEIEELFPKNDLSIIKLANSSSMLYEINSEPLFYDLYGKGTQLAPTRSKLNSNHHSCSLEEVS
jgi:hypothetical protein